MDCACVEYLWIIVMFLSAVWTLILTAPIHCRASIGNTMFIQIYSKEETNSSRLHLRLIEGEYIFIFERTTPLTTTSMAYCLQKLILPN